MKNKIISKIDSSITMKDLLSKLEDQYFEVKGSKTKHTKLANEIIAMLNADGGLLVFGISKKREIEDLNLLDNEVLDHYRKIVFDYIKPPANVELEEIILPSGKLIFLYHISQDYERLFSRKDKSEAVFLRVADACKGPLNREEVRKLEYDKSIRSFEDQILDSFDAKDFDFSKLKKYKEKLKFKGSLNELLVTRNLAIKNKNSYKFKNSAILLFSKNPDKYIPSSYIRYTRYDGIEERVGEEHNVIKDEIFYDNIPGLIETLKKFMYVSLKDYYYLNIDEGKFNKITEYPEEAYLEGIICKI